MHCFAHQRCAISCCCGRFRLAVSFVVDTPQISAAVLPIGLPRAPSQAWSLMACMLVPQAMQTGPKLLAVSEDSNLRGCTVLRLHLRHTGANTYCMTCDSCSSVQSTLCGLCRADTLLLLLSPPQVDRLEGARSKDIPYASAVCIADMLTGPSPCALCQGR